MSADRTIEVDPQRLERWVVGFGERHGGATMMLDGGSLTLSAPDGATATLSSWTQASSAVVNDPEGLTAWARPPEHLGLILVRRGGYAVGVATGAELTRHKCGTRYVQSRTAAGGWSQQRFARRRGNQADELVGAVIEHVVGIVRPAGVVGLVLGGDRALAAHVVADPRLVGLAAWPRRELYDLPDPRLSVLTDALRRARSVRIRLREAPVPGGAPATTR